MDYPANALELFDELYALVETTSTNRDELQADFALMVAENVETDGIDVEELGDMAESSDASEYAPTIRKVLERIPFEDIAGLGQGWEGYREGIASLAVDELTEGYGRNRPSKGIYWDMKLHTPFAVDKAIDRALDQAFGFTTDEIQELVYAAMDYDTLSWVLDGDQWNYWLESYPYLLEAYRQGRIVHEYKGPHLTGYVTFGEMIDVMRFEADDMRQKLTDSLAIDWYTQSVTMALQQVTLIAFPDFEIDWYTLIYVDTAGDDYDATIEVGDEMSTALKCVGDRFSEGKRLRERHGYVIA